jgi:oligoribonuclease (3'-5' exoribonuclease)
MCIQGYLEEVVEVKCLACLSKYVKYRIDLVVGNEVFLDNRVLFTSDIPTYCLTRRVTSRAHGGTARDINAKRLRDY